jgi:flavin-binding protein dodecin
MSHDDDDHKRGSSDESFAKAAKDAVRRYEDWCKEHGKTPVSEAEVDFRVGIKPDSSLSEYIVILKIDD